MTIGKKIAAGFAIGLTIFMATSLLLYRSTTTLVETGQAVTSTNLVLQTIEKVLSLLKDRETGQRGYLLTEDPKFLEPFEEGRPALIKARERLGDLLKEEVRKDMDQAAEKMKLFQQLEVEIEERGHYTNATILMAEKGRLDDPVKALEEVAQKALDELRERDPRLFAEVGARHVLNLVEAFRPTIANLTKPTGMEAARAMVKQGRGKALMDRVRATCAEIERLETEALEEREKAAKDSTFIAKLTIVAGTGLAFLVVGLFGFFIVRSINSTVYSGVSELTSTGKEIQASAAQQAAGAQEQAAAVAQTVTTVNEASQTAEQSAQRARAVGDTAQRTLEIGKTGRKTVDDSLQAMDAVKEKVETTAQNILMLAEQAQTIGDIIVTVNDIAEQTNILALNAAIEASRAGEQGRGFSVVAGEVKALADQSKKATAQVRQILGEIQKATHTAVLSTEEVTKGVASAIKVGDQAGETIKTLSEALTDMVRTVTQIAASVGQQATGMAQINQAMKNIDTVAKQNTVATRQAIQAAEKLNALGVRLARFIGK